jgi:ABC-type ATPase with predicted acetyltransferase domain
MALKKCHECGAEISTAAKACPKCGAPAPLEAIGKGLMGLGCLLILVPIAIVLLIIVFSVIF